MSCHDGRQVVYPAPYSVLRITGRSSELMDILSGGICSVRVEVTNNGWVVFDSFENQFVYFDPTDVLHAVAVHLELPPVNPLRVLPNRG